MILLVIVLAAGAWLVLPPGLRTILRRGGRSLSRAARAATRSARRVAVLVTVVCAVSAYVLQSSLWWAAPAAALVAFVVAAAAAGRLQSAGSSPSMAVAALAAAVPPLLPLVTAQGADLGPLAEHVRLAAPTAVVVAGLCGALAAGGAGRLLGGGRATPATIAAGLKVRREDLPGLRVHRDRSTGVTYVSGVPIEQRARMNDASRDLLTRLHPGHDVDMDPATGAITLRPLSADHVSRAELLDSSGGMIAGLEELGDKPLRPRAARLVPPEAGWRYGDGEVLAARARQLTGRELVDFRPAEGAAVVAALPADHVRLRDRIAAVLGARQAPWQVELGTRTATDQTTGRSRLDQVFIARHPDLAIPAEKASALWREVATNVVPGGSVGWAVEENRWAGRVLLRWGLRPELPARVALADLLPDRLDPDDWAHLPLGIDPDGGVAAIDLLAGPHSLVVGPTGAGKTVALLTSVTGALCRGHSLVVVDPTKAGLDFLSLRSWCTAWADTLESARAVLQNVYAEVGRRKAVLQREGEVKWSDLPPQVRATERIRPLTVLVDEASSLFIPPDTKVVNALPKDDPEREELTAQAADKAMIKLLVGKLAREARFVGVHLQIGTQRPDAEILGGELRSNLTSVVQLTKPGAVPSSQALGMVFSAEQAPQAVEVLGVLDDGKSPGLAVVAAEGGTVRGLRVGYAPMRDIPALLKARGVPLAEPLASLPRTEPAPAFAPTGEPATVVGEELEVVGEELEVEAMELTWDDLGGDLADLFGAPPN